MQFRHIVSRTLCTASLAAIAFAHHVSTPLSYIQGSDVLDEIVFYAQSGNFGVPPYVITGGELDHHQIVAIADGDTFFVKDQDGKQQRVTFRASDFADPANPEVEEALAAIGTKTTLLSGFDANGYGVVRGALGGASASVELIDGSGAPLAKLGFAPGKVFGASSVQLDLSIPLPDAHADDSLAHHPYLIVASTTQGTFDLGGGLALPLVPDATTSMFLDATAIGALPGFLGLLDDNEDGKAKLAGQALAAAYGSGAPDAIYFAYVVLEEDLSGVAFVSNRFTLDVVQ